MLPDGKYRRERDSELETFNVGLLLELALFLIILASATVHRLYVFLLSLQAAYASKKNASSTFTTVEILV